MSKIIVTQVQGSITSPVLTLPTTNPSANNLVQSDASGNLSFTGTPSVASITASGTVSGSGLIAPTIRSTPSTTNFTIPTADGTNGQVLTTNGSGVWSFASASASLFGTSNPTTSTVATAGTVYANTNSYEIFVCMGTRVVSGSTIYMWEGSAGTNIGIPQGQQAYTTAGTNSFTVPAGVYQLSVVLIGGGGGGSYNWGTSGGGGGALAYATFATTPGTVYSVVVGAGGTRNGNGGASSIATGGTTLFSAQGGLSLSGTGTRALPVSGSITCYGGQGGLSGIPGVGFYVGGGGSGGYGNTTTGADAIGADGSYGDYTGGGDAFGTYGQASNGAGGAGTGYSSSTYGFGGGGGVGIWGRGTSGASSTDGWSYGNGFSGQTGGFGGSNGGRGAGNTNTNNTTFIPGTTTTYTQYSGCGGLWGGGAGGGGSSQTNNANFNLGGVGAARIIWGLSARQYPNPVPDLATIA